jgi:hypothetical protein
MNHRIEMEREGTSKKSRGKSIQSGETEGKRFNRVSARVRKYKKGNRVRTKAKRENIKGTVQRDDSSPN